MKEKGDQGTNLVRVARHVVHQQEAGHEATEDKVVRRIHGPKAPEGVVRRVLAEAERLPCSQARVGVQAVDAHTMRDRGG